MTALSLYMYDVVVNKDKKLRHREEHSASVELSWFIFLHFFGRKSANQPLLRNWP